MSDIAETNKTFTLGTPDLVCRWRLAGGRLPLENRHLRALGRRHLQGQAMDPALVAWAKQHIEWTLREGSQEHPDGILMIIVDDQGQAAMTVGPYEGLPGQTLADLRRRAQAARAEGRETGLAPETLWVLREGVLYWGLDEGATPSGAASLVEDLARTLGLPVERSASLLDDLGTGLLTVEEAFLVSDEHGVVPASDASGEEGASFRAGYDRLLRKTRNQGR